MDWAYTSLLSAALGLRIMASSGHFSRPWRASASASVSSSNLTNSCCDSFGATDPFNLSKSRRAFLMPIEFPVSSSSKTLFGLTEQREGQPLGVGIEPMARRHRLPGFAAAGVNEKTTIVG